MVCLHERRTEHISAQGWYLLGVGDGTGDDPGRFTLVTDATDLAHAEPYLHFLTYPGAHYEVWERWRSLGPAGLAKRGLPKLIAWHEYEEFPRGRIVFDTETDTFIIYADRRLQGADQVEAIRRAFGLEHATMVVRSDAHYQTPPPRP
ncbi:hypothetical protein [Microvirga arabica]|uniref:hypothetical protein n=1 Tax=Microvirga arabica TaxID=1128671 RepID=UPI00193A46E2|nr:hypothetical protein [Microvirga arabica]MBM1172844.1 hypothetical protein [Microvirga arabica]